MSCAELAEARYDVRFLVEGALVELQPAFIGGAAKDCKTLIGLDLAFALATATPFLRELNVPEAARVGYMTARVACLLSRTTVAEFAAAHGFALGDVGGLVFCDTLPQLANLEDVDALRAFVTDNELLVVVLDPLYLCMPGDDAGNILKQGKVLRHVNRVCIGAGCMPVLIHHLRKRPAICTSRRNCPT